MRSCVPNRFLLRFCGLALTCGMTMQTGAAQQVNQHATSLIYDVEMDVRTPQQVFWHHVLYDNGKYWDGTIFPTSHLKEPVYVELYDGSKPYIAWGCRLDEHRASPLPAACQYALSVAAGRDGVEAVRQRYHIPTGHSIYPAKDDPPRPSSILKTKSDFPRLTGPAVGSGNVAGYMCQIYESRVSQKTESSRDGVPGSVMLQQTHETRAWVEPRTGLVLKLEERQIAAPGSPVPPSATGYVVKKLLLPASIPLERFQLPPGTTANVARIFGDVKLPSGVKRVLPPPEAADIGMSFAH